MTRVVDYLKGRLLRFILLCLVAYAALAAMTEAPLLILFGYGIVMSLSVGVCVAYAPVLASAVLNPHPTKGDYLATGIFLIWTSWVATPLLSFVARDFGWPGIYNTDWTSFTVLLAFVAALLHLWAPNAVDGSLPRARWATTGLIVAVGFFIALTLWSVRFSTVHPTVQLR